VVGLTLITGIGTGIAMYFLRMKLYLNEVRASAWTVLLVGLISKHLDLGADHALLAACVSYAAMSDEVILKDFKSYALVGLLTSITFLIFKDTLEGIGGRLGVFAFISTLIYTAVKRMRDKLW
jgi:hypothetical protein